MRNDWHCYLNLRTFALLLLLRYFFILSSTHKFIIQFDCTNIYFQAVPLHQNPINYPSLNSDECKCEVDIEIEKKSKKKQHIQWCLLLPGRIYKYTSIFFFCFTYFSYNCVSSHYSFICKIFIICFSDILRWYGCFCVCEGNKILLNLAKHERYNLIN